MQILKEKPSLNKGVLSHQSHQLEDDDDDIDCNHDLDDSNDTDHDYHHQKITIKLVMKELGDCSAQFYSPRWTCIHQRQTDKPEKTQSQAAG